MRKLKSLAVHLTVAVTLSVTGVAVAASFDNGKAPQVIDSGPNTQATSNVTDQGGTAFGPNGVVTANEPVADVPTEVAPSVPADVPTDEPASITPGVTANEPEPVVAPEPVVVPPPVRATSKVMRFVDISPASAPNTVAQQWCDYTYSDGTSGTKLNSTLTKEGGFSQPIQNYSDTNRPSFIGNCK